MAEPTATIDKTFVEFKESRGRPESDERRFLVNLDIGQSFTSCKRRETLYQIARTIGVKVSIMKDLDEHKRWTGLWRVWKKSHPIGPRTRRTHRGLVKTA